MTREAGKAVGDQPSNAGQVVGWDRVGEREMWHEGMAREVEKCGGGVAYDNLSDVRLELVFAIASSPASVIFLRTQNRPKRAGQPSSRQGVSWAMYVLAASC